MTSGRAGAVCAMLFAVYGCAQSTPPFVYGERMGLANWRENRGCLAAFNASIAPGTKVALVHQPLYEELPTVKEATVGERLSKACDPGLDTTNNMGVSPSFYSVAAADGTTPSGIVFTILDPPALPIVRDGHVEADLDGDNAAESFRACTSAENVHFMVWTGSPAQGRPRWRGFFYAGYDMVPSCTEQDVAGMIILDKGK